MSVSTGQNSDMPQKEASARIKINKLLESAGWRFFDDAHGPANIALESNAKLTLQQVDAMGDDFQTTANGFIDFLLLDDKGFPLVVLEAKAENKNPLIGKEQARKYAKAKNCRFVSCPTETCTNCGTWPGDKAFTFLLKNDYRSSIISSVPLNQFM